MFADSMEYIWFSSMEIWAEVCSRECSWAFLRFRAVRAAVSENLSAVCILQRIKISPIRNDEALKGWCC